MQTSKKGACEQAPLKRLENLNFQLPLGELERAAGFRLAVLLALDDAAVAGQEAALLEDAAQFRLVIGESLGDAMTHGASLAGETATGDGDVDVVLAGAVGRDDRLLQDQRTARLITSGPRQRKHSRAACSR